MNKRISKTWIDTKLSSKERRALVSSLLDISNNPTGEQILDTIKTLFPAKAAPSDQSCLNWKKQQWQFELYLTELEATNRDAKLISDNSADIADANKKMVDSYVFEQLMAMRNGGEIDVKALKSWIVAASNLASRSVADKRLESDLKKSKALLEKQALEISELKKDITERELAKAKALTNIKQDKSLSKTAIENIEQQLKLL